jgi:hypothetical protein
MPKSDIALQGRVFIKEELVSDPDHADEKPSFLGRKAKKKAAQWEAERVGSGAAVLLRILNLEKSP